MAHTHTVRVARFFGKEDVRFVEIPTPPLNEGQVRIRNAYDGVCGTDVHLFFDPEHSVVPFTRNESGEIVPIPMGHEYSGTVTEIGPGVTKVAVGDRVAVFPVPYCGECEVCQSGAPAFMCPNQRGVSGGIGEFDVQHERHLHKLPESVSLLQGALVEPMAVSYHGVRIANPQPDDTVVIAGAGPIGVGVYLALKALKVRNILVSEPSAERRAVIANLGATTVDPLNEDLKARVHEASGGRGAAAFFDAAGVGPVFSQGIGLLGAYGQYIAIAVHTKPVTFDAWELQVAERRIFGSIIYTPQDFDDVINLMASGAYPTDGWVSVRPAQDITDVMADLKAGKGTKVLLEV